VINRIPFCFGNLMVRRKRNPKGCREREKNTKKVKQPPVLTGTAFVSH
jgi:hypothetical protein